MKTNLKIVSIIFAVIIVILLGVLALWHPAQSPTLSSIATSSTSEQHTILSSDGNLSIDADSLHANDVVVSPLVINGEVTGGGWFFKSTFPVKVLDGDGTVIGTATAYAESDATITGSVPFQVAVTFKKPNYKIGTVVLENNNPSGNPATARALDIPVRFDQ